MTTPLSLSLQELRKIARQAAAGAAAEAAEAEIVPAGLLIEQRDTVRAPAAKAPVKKKAAKTRVSMHRRTLRSSRVKTAPRRARG